VQLTWINDVSPLVFFQPPLFSIFLKVLFMKPKTIWLINQYASTPETGFGGRHYYLALELAKQGHKVYLIGASYTHLLREPPKVEETYTIKDIEGFHFVWIKMPKYNGAHDKKRILNWFLFSAKLLGLAKFIKDKPDVILSSSPSLFSVLGARRLAKKFSAKLVFEVRDIWPLTLVELGGYSKKHPFIMLAQWVEDYAYRVSDKVVSNLPKANDHMVTRGMDRDKFTWIPNGFSMDEIKASEPLPQKTIDQLPKDKFVIGYTGTFGHANALEYLIDAAKLHEDKTDIAFVLVGDGREKQALLKKIDALGLKNVHLINPIPKTQIQSMLTNFDVCYIGLKDESLFRFGVSPNKLFDYLIAARPIIYAINSGNKPVDEAKCGVSIPAENSQEIASAILELKTLSATKRAQMGEYGKRLAEEKHDYSKLAAKLAKEVFC